MKKLLVSMVLTMLMVSAGWAQHLTFKGIPMEGTAKAFAQKLVAKGFKQVAAEDNLYVLKGSFAGYSDCSVGIVGNTAGNVFKAVVFFDDFDKWGGLETQYIKIKNMLTQKYGTPDIVVEEWKDGADLSDYLKMSQIRNEEVTYGCAWEVEGGSIEITLVEGVDYSTARVRLVYFDEAGQKEAIQSAIDDL